MSKNSKPIVIVAGDPKSIFLEIFFKSLKRKKFRNPIILIVNKKLLFQQMKDLSYNFQVNKLNEKYINFDNLNNNKINFIDIPFNKERVANYINQSF